MDAEREQEVIEQILQNFKFELVYAYMKMVGWTYFDSSETPTIRKLEETARYVLEKCQKKHGHGLKTGGFEAECTNVEDCGLTLTLRFVPLQVEEYL